MLLFISHSYRRLEGMMKRNMRVRSPRVGDPNPQTAGWFDPQADTEVVRAGFCLRRGRPVTLKADAQPTDVKQRYRHPESNSTAVAKTSGYLRASKGFD